MPAVFPTQGLVRIATFFGGAFCLSGLFRFPGLVSQYGGGAFFIAYVVCLMLLGRPLLRAVWQWFGDACAQDDRSSCGFTSSHSFWDKPLAWAGASLATLTGLALTLIAAWCLGLAWKLVAGPPALDHGKTFATLTGQTENGVLWTSGTPGALPWLALVVPLVFLLPRSVAKRWPHLLRLALPLALLVVILLLLPRLLALGAPHSAVPSHSVASGLDLIWQPSRLVLEERPAGQTRFYRRVTLLPGSPAHLNAVAASVAAADTFQTSRIGLGQALCDPRVWLAAVGQVGLSLMFAAGSFLSTKTNWPGGRQWPEAPALWLGLLAGGPLGCLLCLPAAAAFLGGATPDSGPFGLLGAALPSALSQLPGGGVWGGLFFLLLGISALAAAAGLLRMVAQFLETTLRTTQAKAFFLLLPVHVACLGALTWATRSHSALAQMDFWAGILAVVYVTGLLLRSASSRQVPSGHLTPVTSTSRLKRLLAGFRHLLGWGIRWTPPVLILGIFAYWTTHQILALTVTDRKFRLETQVGSLFAPDAAQGAWFGLFSVFLNLLFFALVLKIFKRYCHRT